MYADKALEVCYTITIIRNHQNNTGNYFQAPMSGAYSLGLWAAKAYVIL